MIHPQKPDGADSLSPRSHRLRRAAQKAKGGVSHLLKVCRINDFGEEKNGKDPDHIHDAPEKALDWSTMIHALFGNM